MRDQRVWRREDSHFLVLRYEVFQLFEFDRCLATVCHSLIAWDSHISNELKISGSGSDPICYISREQIRKDCLGTVSIRKIDEALDRFEKLGIVDTRPPAYIGGKTGILLKVDVLNGLLKALPAEENIPQPADTPNRRNAWVAQRSSVGIDADEEEVDQTASVPTTDGINADGRSASMPTVYKEERTVIKELPKELSDECFSENHNLQNQNPTPTPTPAAAEGSEEPREVQTQHVSQKHFDAYLLSGKLISGLKSARLKPHSTTRKRLNELLERLNQDGVGDEIIWQAFHRFKTLDHSATHNTGATFINYLIACCQDTPRKAQRREPAASPAQRSTPAPTTSTPQVAGGAENASKPSLPDYVLRWNAAMPEPLQVVRWGKNARVAELAVAERDPDFTDNFDAICRKCRLYFESGQMAKINFDWLFRESKGRVNWYHVIMDYFAWAEQSKDKAGKPKSVFDGLDEKIARLEREERERQIKQNGATNGKDGIESSQSREVIGSVGLSIPNADDGKGSQGLGSVAPGDSQRLGQGRMAG